MNDQKKSMNVFWVFVLCMSTAVGSLFATSGTWNGTQDTYWTNSVNWSVALYPGTAIGETATFNNAGGSSDIVDIDGLISVKNITFDAVACAAYTIGTSPLQALVFENGGKIMLGVATNNMQEIKASLQLGSADGTASYYLENNNPLKSLILSGNSAPFGTGTKTLYLQGSSGTGVVSGVISGTFTGANAIQKDGWSTWTLTGNNTFAGNVNVVKGPVIINKSSALGTGNKTVYLTNGSAGSPQLHLDGSAAPIDLGANIVFQSSCVTANGAIQNFAGNNIIRGNFTMTTGGGGTLITSHKDKLTLTGNIAPNTAGRELLLRGKGDGEISGIIANGLTPNMLVKKDADFGIWTLSGANTFTGSAGVWYGKLIISGVNGKVGGGVSVYNTATLDVVNTFNSNHANRIADTGALTMNGGTFRYINTGGNAHYSETVGALLVSSGVNTIFTSQASSGQSGTLIFSSGLTYSLGTLNFTGTGLGDSDRNRIFITGQSDGLIGLWATVNGTNYAAYSSTRGVYASSAVVTTTGIAARGPSSIIPNNAFSTADITTPGETGPITLADNDTSIYALQQKHETNAVVATAGQTLRTTAVAMMAGKGSLTFGENEDDGTLTALNKGGTLTLDNANETLSLTVNAKIADNASASSLVKSGAGDVVLTGANAYTGPTSIDAGKLVMGGATSKAFSSAMSGAGSLAKVGASTLTLSGNNVFSGGLSVAEGTLVAAHANALGAGPVVNESIINLSLSGVTYSGLATALSGMGTVNVLALGTVGTTVNLNGNYSDFTGVWNIGPNHGAASGKVQMNGLDNASATINVYTNATVFSTGTVTHKATINLHGGDTGESYGQLRLDSNATWAGPVNIKAASTNDGDGLLGSNAGTGYITGVIDDAGAGIVLDKAGASTLALLAANTFTGDTWVKQGTVQVPSVGKLADLSSPLGKGGKIMLGRAANGGRLQYNGTTDDESNRPIEMSGSTATAYLRHIGSGMWTLTGNITSPYAGNKQLRLEGNVGTTGILTGVISDYDENSTNNLYKLEAGTWVLSGNNTFKGNVEANNGVLVIKHNRALGIGPKTAQAAYNTGGANAYFVLDGSNGDLTIPADITFRTSDVTQGAIVNVAGNNTIQGPLNLIGGDGDTVLNSMAGSLTVTGDAFAMETVRRLRFWGDADGEISGVISNGLTTTGLPLWKEFGSGSWLLSGNNTYSGSTMVSAGKIIVGGIAGRIDAGAGIVINGGTFAIDNSVAVSGDRVADGNTVTMSNGAFRVQHTAISDQIYSETVAALIISGGINTISADQAADGMTSALSFASLTRTAGIVNFEGVGLGDSGNARNRIKIGGQPDGLIGTWAKVNGTAYAAYDYVRGVYAADPSLVPGINAKGPQEIPNDATTNLVINAEGTEGPLTLAGATETSIKSMVQDSNWDSTVAMTNQTFKVDELMIFTGKMGLTLGTDRNEGALAPLTSSGTLWLMNNSGSTLTINAPVVNNGTSKVDKQGEGKVVLAGTNTYTGATTINQGTLELNAPATLTHPGTIANNGQLTLAGTDNTVTQTLSGIISGAGVVTKTSANVVRLNAANTFTGPLTNSSGTIIAGNATALGTIAGETVIESGATLEVNGQNLGSERVLVQGDGVDNLGAINNSGVLQQYAFKYLTLANDATFGGTNRFDIRGAPATFDMGGHKLTQLNTYGFYIVATVITNTGSFDVKQGALTVETSSTTDGNASNTVTLRSGASLGMYQTANPIPWTILAEGGTFIRANSSTLATHNRLQGPVMLEGATEFVNSGVMTIGGAITDAPAKSGSIIKSGTYQLSLTNANNSYSGTTIISNGTLYAQYAGSLPAYNSDKVTVVPGAVLQVLAATNGVETGWTSEQIAAISESTFSLSNCWLAVDAPADFDYVYNFPQYPNGMGFRKLGVGTMTIPQNQTILGGLYVQGGSLVLNNVTWQTAQITAELALLAGETAQLTLAGNSVLTSFLNPNNVGPYNSLAVGRAGRATLVLKDNAVVTNRLLVGDVNTSAGAVYQSGNSTMFNWGGQGNDGRLGNSGYGYYELNSGTFTNHGFFQMAGGSTTGIGVLVQKGGMFYQNNTYGGQFALNRGGTGIIYTDGGTFVTVNQIVLGETSGASTTSGNAVFTADGNADVNIAGNFTLSDRINAFSAVNLNGGTICANQFSKGNKTGNSAFVNFDGGTFKSRMTGNIINTGTGAPTAVNIFEGGATFDTAGFNSTIPVSLASPAGYGVTAISLTASGSGYIGSPMVTISGGGGVGATAIAEFDSINRVITGIKITSAGTGFTSTPAVTLSGGGGSGATATAAIQMNISGGLAKSGAGILTLSATNTYAGVTTVTDGILGLGNASALPIGTDVIVTGGLFSLGGYTVTSGVVTVTGGLIANGTLDATEYLVSGSGMLLASLQGNANLIKRGLGTVQVSSLGYTGETRVEEGTLKLNAPMLAHRWSFNNDYTDSVGTADATPSGTVFLEATQATFPGGVNGTAAIKLPSGILPTSNAPATIELWATQHSIQNWSRIFDFGAPGSTNYLCMTWCQGTAISNDRVEARISAATATLANGTLQPYTLEQEFHISMVIIPGVGSTGNTLVRWYKKDVVTGETIKSGSFSTPWSLDQLDQRELWLGRSKTAADYDANASYNEVRIWNGALTEGQLTASALAGADVLPADITTISNVVIAVGATVDMDGGTYKVSNISGLGTVTNGTLAITGTLSPAGTSVGDLALDCNVALSGTLSLNVGVSTIDRVRVTGNLDVAGATIFVANPSALLGRVWTVVETTGTITGDITWPLMNRPDANWKVLKTGNTIKLAPSGTTIMFR